MITNEATLAQIAAADPAFSTWVSANAGSGKTRVLTDRVARLLLHGSDPQSILCLTYTNAAAAEMQNRLFKRLGSWSMMPDADLTAALAELGELPAFLTAENLKNARTLFARALETPGGLKIQTIHAFCDALLRQFPLEAGVTPQFEILDDRQAEQTRRDIAQDLAQTEPDAFRRLAQLHTQADLDSLLKEIADKKEQFTKAPLAADFGLATNITTADIKIDFWRAVDLSVFPTILEILKQNQDSVKAHEKICTTFSICISQGTTETAFDTVLSGSLTAAGTISKTFKPNAAFKKEHPELFATFLDMKEALNESLAQLNNLNAFKRAKALYGFARPFITSYDTYKLLTGKLDYNDLINKANTLLTDNALSKWVLFRLDGAIDHVLVDEAQDTSPNQWKLVEKLTEEFTAGLGARNNHRTIFVVGDDKQSIYSFQGADPDYFDAMRQSFKTKLDAVDDPLQQQSLLYSFRSADPILRVTDATFVAQNDAMFANKHKAFHSDKPGRVELWPLIEKLEKPEDAPWYIPVDRPGLNDPKLILARNIATWVDDTIASGQKIEIEKELRPVHAGDFLILVQSRGLLFNAIIKELKAQKLDVAGADVLNIGQELAVKDILSLLKFALTPEDDLSLAEALKSPLFGITESQLFTLAYNRPNSLWQNLRAHKETHFATWEVLSDMLANADLMRPYELIERILTHHKGRELILARLGLEAEEALDELLTQAMLYEQMEPPSLTGFLNWFSSGDVKIKRQNDSGAGMIRVMTVHGAKGLEAPIVILPDTVDKKNTDTSETIELETGCVGWKTAAAQRSALEAERVEHQKERSLREKLRLLYVAMTRAESWLIVCGAGKLGKEPALNWYDMVAKGLEHAGAITDDNDKIVFENSEWSALEFSPDNTAQAQSAPPAPDWLTQNAPTPPKRNIALSPSDLGGAKALPSELDNWSEDEARGRGTLIHALLEHVNLDQAVNWQELCAQAIVQNKLTLSDAIQSDAINIVQAVIQKPELEFLFSSASLAEVPLTAPLPELAGTRIMGIIDRLIITDDRVHIVDIKSNHAIPATSNDTPEGLKRQMGAYLSAIKQIYPNHSIDVSILWTQTQSLMSFSHEDVTQALKRTTLS